MHTTLDHDPVVRRRPAVPYVGTRRTVTMSSMAVIADRLPELAGWLALRGLAPAGPPFLRYQVIDMEALLVVEAGVPVPTRVEGTGDVHGGTLPSGAYVTVTHRGHPDSLVGATGDLLRWAADRAFGFDVANAADGEHWGCRLENYLTNPAEEPDMSRWETELAFRLAD